MEKTNFVKEEKIYVTTGLLSRQNSSIVLILTLSHET
jgi:hypothetical protein